MTWLALFFALELGYLPGGVVETYYFEKPEWMELQGSFFTEFEAEAELFGVGFIGGELKTYMNKYAVNKSFKPLAAEYAFYAGLRWSALELGFRHYCTHPVVPWMYYQDVTPQWESWYEEIYLRLEVEK
jgi:hypothetical protein